MSAAKLLASPLALLLAALTTGPALAADTSLPVLPAPPAAALPCPLPITAGCITLPVPVPTPGAGRPQPFATPTPTVRPTAQPTASPGQGQPPAPAPGQIPTDFGIQAMTHWVYNGGSWLAPQIYPMLTAPVGPTDWFGPLYQHMVNIGFLLLLLFTVLGVGCAILRRDLVLLVKVPCWYVPISMFVTALAVLFTQLLERITDGFTDYMLQGGFGDHLSTLLIRGGALLGAAVAGGVFAGSESFIAFVAVLTFIAGLALALVELIARTVAIYACLLFVPVTVVCLVWPPVARIARLMLEVIVGLIVLKFIVAAVLALSAAMLAANPVSMGPQGDPGVITIVMGAVVLLTGVLGGPFMLAKAIPFAEHQAALHWTNQPRRLADRVGLTNIRQLHTAYLGRFGNQESRDKLAQGGRLQLVLPKGSRVYVRSPKALEPQGRAANRRRP
ncbi:MAG: hypothetical protein DLM58_08200 [Pseudonocardiales bacterium]|nr:MAG: hypothetical protein DLM58_08200 [Pseudonocardiales bacterium]